jgi:hypothetical protein
MSLWMTKHKKELRALVKAMIQIEPSAPTRLAIKAFAPMFGNFWGYPLLAAASKAEALDVAKKLLSTSDRAADAAK